MLTLGDISWFVNPCRALFSLIDLVSLRDASWLVNPYDTYSETLRWAHYIGDTAMQPYR